ncbi:uncharacterized protein RHO25_003222 [Cercospora beticola]|uniref:Secreted protein n=1 Tax=Cercospora beticola TaxID=122368 RepID=A0ABZ0NGF3_CERBT|nr:hypothetical protein RHO25_003222 [Cercospora beticola]
MNDVALPLSMLADWLCALTAATLRHTSCRPAGVLWFAVMISSETCPIDSAAEARTSSQAAGTSSGVLPQTCNRIWWKLADHNRYQYPSACTPNSTRAPHRHPLIVSQPGRRATSGTGALRRTQCRISAKIWIDFISTETGWLGYACRVASVRRQCFHVPR